MNYEIYILLPVILKLDHNWGTFVEKEFPP